jgi:tRNA-dihydrouridine synthase B
MSSTKFHVRDIAVENDLILAPMDGYSDYPYRSICRRYGSGMSYTAFVSAIDLLQDSDEAWHALKYAPAERPIVFQICDNDEQRILDAAIKIEHLEPDIIDINMGCWVRRVSGRGAGAGLLRDPHKVGRIVARLSSLLSVPITAKIRLGWDEDERNYLDVADAIEQNGGALIAVHGRTRAQGYRGTADWDAIARIKQNVHIPVIGNGDVRSLEDVNKLFKHTSCDGVMIGRGAIGNPWIFARRRLQEVPLNEVEGVVFDHLSKMLSYHGDHKGLLRFRKHLKAYLRHFEISREVMQSLLTCTSTKELRKRITTVFNSLASTTKTVPSEVNQKELHTN